ncbi:MAG: hypothetical protein ACYTF0_05840 [Planctomycetota bacterium]|jgi:hypothetical protein
MKYGIGVTMPNLVDLPADYGNLVPSYDYHYWDAYWGGHQLFEAGGTHVLTLDYRYEALPLPLIAQTTANYHDGAFGFEPGLSHATLSVSTTWSHEAWYISPGLHAQASFEDSVNEDDELWATLTVGWAR